METQNRQIVVSGRRWFQATYGNTYHSVKVWIDGKCVGYMPYSYGYGDQYLQSAMGILVELGIYEKEYDGYYQTIHGAARRAGDTLTCTVADVRRKKDLAQ